jgi:hypothetical protein
MYRESTTSILVEKLRTARCGVPKGTFYAPTFTLEDRENHGMGYHCHVRKLKSGGHKRSGYLVTMHLGQIYITPHGGEEQFNLSKMFNAVKKDIHEKALKSLSKIPSAQLLPITSQSVLLS